MSDHSDDDSPDAIERYLAKQEAISRWVDWTMQHVPANPFTPVENPPLFDAYPQSPSIQHHYSSHKQAAIARWVDRTKQHKLVNPFTPLSESGKGKGEYLKVPPQSPPQIQQSPYGYPYPYRYQYPYQYQYPYSAMSL